MDSLIEIFGWTVFNIAIPLLAPLALLPLTLASVPRREQYAGVVRFAIKDGQMLWAVIPMSASGCHMLSVAIDAQMPANQLMWSFLAFHVVVIVVASVLVTLATMHAFRCSVRRRRAHVAAYRIPLIWVVVTVASAVAHFGGYVWLIRPVFRM